MKWKKIKRPDQNSGAEHDDKRGKQSWQRHGHASRVLAWQATVPDCDRYFVRCERRLQCVPVLRSASGQTQAGFALFGSPAFGCKCGYRWRQPIERGQQNQFVAEVMHLPRSTVAVIRFRTKVSVPFATFHPHDRDGFGIQEQIIRLSYP